jgi:hypothetical protein
MFDQDLSRLAVRFRGSAAILRAHGRENEARRAERFSLRIGLSLEDPRAMQRIHDLCRDVDESPRLVVALERALDGAMSLLDADFGNVQLVNPATGELRIVAESGFSSEFLDYFSRVDDEGSACGRAARRRSQTVIVDVDEDPAFAPHREIAAASGFRAVQSTPLVDPTGRLRGVISTHFRRPRRPSGRELQIMEWYADRVAAAVGHQLVAPTTLFAANASLHERTADLHEATASLMFERAQVALAAGHAVEAADRLKKATRAWVHVGRERERARALNQRAHASPR